MREMSWSDVTALWSVELQVKRPLMPVQLSPEQVGLEMLCLCGQLDLLIRAQMQQVDVCFLNFVLVFINFQVKLQSDVPSNISLFQCELEKMGKKYDLYMLACGKDLRRSGIPECILKKITSSSSQTVSKGLQYYFFCVTKYIF